jgi:SAM-dependent methyltransferase
MFLCASSPIGPVESKTSSGLNLRAKVQRLNKATDTAVGTSSFVWTRTSIGHFWDLVAKEPRLQKLYFSRQLATYIIQLAQYAGLDSGRVLDYGCGPGYLAKALVENGYDTTALEFSEASAERVNRLISPATNWHGCIASQSVPTPLPDAAFSWIFSIETYEHLLDEWTDGYFREMLRLLRPGGQLILTTPYMEDLDDCLIVCPACETKFHRWGHLRSVSPNELVSRARNAGYDVVFCRTIDLCAVGRELQWPSLQELSIRLLVIRMKQKYHRLIEQKHTPQFPNQYHVRTLPAGQHLVLVAKKQS